MKNPEYRIEKYESTAVGDGVYVYRNVYFPELHKDGWQPVRETSYFEYIDLVPRRRGLGWLLGYKEITRSCPSTTRRNFGTIEAAQGYIKEDRELTRSPQLVQKIDVYGDGSEEWDPPKEQ